MPNPQPPCPCGSGYAGAVGGEIYALSSEPQTLASKAASAWEFGFASIGDPHHEISGACR